MALSSTAPQAQWSRSFITLIRAPGQERILMKYTTVKISEIAAHPTMRLDPGYWLNKKKRGRKGRGARAQARKK